MKSDNNQVTRIRKNDVTFVSDKKINKISIQKKDVNFNKKKKHFNKTKFTTKIVAEKALNTIDKFSDENDGAKFISKSGDYVSKTHRVNKKVKSIKRNFNKNKQEKIKRKNKEKVEKKIIEKKNKSVKIKKYDSKTPKELLKKESNSNLKVIVNKENVKDLSKFSLNKSTNAIDKFSDENDGAKILVKPYQYKEKAVDYKNRFTEAKNVFFKKKVKSKDKIGFKDKFKNKAKDIRNKVISKSKDFTKKTIKQLVSFLLKIISPITTFIGLIFLLLLLIISFLSSKQIEFNSNNNFFELPRTNTPQEFFDVYGEAFKNVGEEYNVYASVMMAQAILETGFGKNIAGANNLFGIKCYNEKYGCTEPLGTSEEVDGGKINIKSRFQQSPEIGIEGAIKLYVDFLANGSSFKAYSKTLTKSYHKSYRSVTKAIVEKLKYATDSSYTEKLNKIISDYDLTKYDTPENPNKKILENIELRIDEGFATNADLGLPVYNEFKTFNNFITSRFGPRKSPVKGVSNFHYGLDIGGKAGTPIYSVADGVVERIRYPFPNQTYGGLKTGANNSIVIKHSNELTTAYLHLKSINVKEGDLVKKGQIIGSMGSTGYSTGVHLHFEVRINGKHIDPETYLKNLNR